MSHGKGRGRFCRNLGGGTVTEILCIKCFGVTKKELLGSRDVIGHVAIGLATYDVLSIEATPLSRIVAKTLRVKHLATPNYQ